MTLYTLADWSLVLLAFGSMTTAVGIVLGKVFTLLERVADLEAWAHEVSDDLAAQKQRLDMQLIRDHQDAIGYVLNHPGDSSGSAA